MDIVEYANYIEQGLSHEDIAERKGYTKEEMKEVLEGLGVVFDGDEADFYKKSHNLEWTKEEDEFLVENYKKMNNKELSVALGRAYGSVSQRKYKLGLTEIRGGYRQWTKEEDDYLRKNYKKMSDKELSIALGRTYPAIVQRKPILGLNKKLKEERIYAAYKGDDKIGVGTLDELAKKTGYAWSTLYHCSKPSRRRRAGKRELKLFEIEES